MDTTICYKSLERSSDLYKLKQITTKVISLLSWDKRVRFSPLDYYPLFNLEGSNSRRTTRARIYRPSPRIPHSTSAGTARFLQVMWWWRWLLLSLAKPSAVVVVPSSWGSVRLSEKIGWWRHLGVVMANWRHHRKWTLLCVLRMCDSSTRPWPCSWSSPPSDSCTSCRLLADSRLWIQTVSSLLHCHHKTNDPKQSKRKQINSTKPDHTKQTKPKKKKKRKRKKKNGDNNW